MAKAKYDIAVFHRAVHFETVGDAGGHGFLA